MTLWLWTVALRLLTFNGISNALLGAWGHLCGNLRMPLAGVCYMILGLSMIVPRVVVFVCGRARLFRIISDRFERGRALHDGAFVAELLDEAGRQVVLGQTW